MGRSQAMAVLMTQHGDSGDPRSMEYWGTSSVGARQTRSYRSEMTNWRFDSTSGVIWGWFVLVCNVCSAIMFVLLEYSLKIVVVDGIFDVQTSTDNFGLDYEVITTMTYSLTWVYLVDLAIR